MSARLLPAEAKCHEASTLNASNSMHDATLGRVFTVIRRPLLGIGCGVSIPSLEGTMRSNRLTRIGVPAAFLSSIMATDASATWVERATLRVIAERSDAVIHGTVIRQESRENVDGLPWTFYTLQVLNVFAGEVSGAEFTFRCAGGLGTSSFTVVQGAPLFVIGDEIVLFYLEGEPVCQVSGFDQGVFRRLSAPSSGATTLVNNNGFEVEALSPDDVVLGSQLDWRIPEGLFTPGDERPVVIDHPVADVGLLLDEFDAFARTFAHRARHVSSTTDFAGALTSQNANVV